MKFADSRGFYFWFSHPQYPTSALLSKLFLDVGLLVTPGTVFGPDGDGYVRMIYCETDNIMQTVAERIALI